VNAEDLITLNEEIAGMARAGLPLDQGLRALAQELSRGRLRRVTAEMAADLQAGRTLPEALQRQGDRVPPYYAALLAAGVRSGRIGEVPTTLTLPPGQLSRGVAGRSPTRKAYIDSDLRRGHRVTWRVRLRGAGWRAHLSL